MLPWTLFISMVAKRVLTLMADNNKGIRHNSLHHRTRNNNYHPSEKWALLTVM